VPAPTNVIPSTPAFPRTIPFGSQPTIPPPPTVQPGTRGVITTPGLSPADLQPRLPTGQGSFGPSPGGTFTTPVPATTIPAQPGATTPITPGVPATTVPGGSFPTSPATPPPSGGFGTGGFGTGTNYAPSADPYSATLTPANSFNGPANSISPSGAAPNGNLQSGPAHSVFGSGYRGNAPARSEPKGVIPSDSNVIRAPDLAPALPPSVRTAPDLDAPQSPKPINSAPQLLDPRDKTARLNNRWAVVPAQWPKKDTTPRQLSDRPVVPTKSYQPQSNGAGAANPADYDDRGWKSAAGF
jgi:hypothetical protein